MTGGPRVLITRPRAQAADLVRALEEWGARAVVFPTVEIRPPADPGPLDRAVGRLPEYDWLVFTSANAVAALFDRLDAGAHPPQAPRIAAVGPATADAVRSRGAGVAFMPSEYLGERLGAELPDPEGQRILIPQGDQAEPLLAESLAARGATVDVVEAYRTAAPERPDPLALAELAVGVDAGIFTSGSAVRHLFTLLGNDATRLALSGAIIACIGPVTSSVARALGLDVQVEPSEHTIPAVVAALRARLAAGTAGTAR